MIDLHSLSELTAELESKERNWAYHLDLLKHDPFNWLLKLDVENLEAEVQALRKAVRVTAMQPCG